MTKVFIKETPNVEQEKFPVGTLFKTGRGNTVSMLCHPDCGMLTMINVDGGNRFFDSVPVPNMFGAWTLEELRETFGSKEIHKFSGSVEITN